MRLKLPKRYSLESGMNRAKSLNYTKGRSGEVEAGQFLIGKGMQLIESNYSIDVGEIDLIMSDSDWLVFVEVKYKKDDRFGIPEEMIDHRKLSQVKRVAQIYLMKNMIIRKSFDKYRIDAVCIMGNRISHYKDIY